ncbi:hypothetical protein MUP51_05300, partial [Candidatus Bathyarchaeota archaeon]|nr:hypothetical protein [Candidatus Bathyarchaeota archaeon]
MQSPSNPCSDIDQSILDLLRDIAKMQMGMGLDYDSAFMEEAREKAEERYQKAEENRKQLQKRIEDIKQSQIDGELDPDDIVDADLDDLEQQLEELSGEQKGVTRKD